MRLRPALPLLIAGLTVACGGGNVGTPESAAPMDSLAGVYSGFFPCDNCAGIDVTLWLRADGRFFIEQRYPEGDGQSAFNAYNLGRWVWRDGDGQIALHGSGPMRVFSKGREDSTLFMQTASPLEHRLERAAVDREFTATLSLSGTVSRRGDRTVFSECATGLDAPLSQGGDYRRFRHQYRSVEGNRGAVYVEFDGHYSWTPEGAPAAVTIDRFVTVKADGAC